MQHITHNIEHRTHNMKHETNGIFYSMLHAPCSMKKGQAALTAVIFFLAAATAIGIGFTTFAFEETATARRQLRAKQSYFLAEAGVEDVVYRLQASKQVGASETLTVNGEIVTTVTTDVGGNKEIVATGDFTSNIRKVKILLEPGTVGINFYYGVQVGEGGLDMDNNAVVNGNVYSNGSITGDNGATILGDVIVAGGLPANPTEAWTAHDADQFFATASANRDIAQSFTATVSGPLNKISVYLGKVGNPTSNITARITTDNGGKPSTSDIADETISFTTVGITPSWIDVSFTGPPSLVSGTKYWIVLDYGSNSATNYWNWRKDSSDAYAGNTGRYAGNWSSGGTTWVDVGGDLAFKTWIGGTTNRIEDVIIGNSTSGSGHANLFVNTTIHGSACPNAYCTVDNQPQEVLPISDGVIQDWRDDATAGGVIAGNYSVTTDVNLGPTKITGDLLMTTNNKILTVNGTIYVQGNVTIDNGSTVRCAASFGSNSCVVVADGWIHIKNNGIFSGSGQSGSYIMLLSASTCDGTSSAPPCDIAHHNGAIDLHNNATGAIFYAAHGLINLHNGVNVTEVTGYKLHLDQTANVTYDAGLANAIFSSGPSGGWDVTTWREVE